MYVDPKLYAVEELANAIIIKAAHDYREAKGTVFHVDDMAQIHVNWDNGSSLALNRDEDSFRKLSVKEVEAENRAVENQDEAPEESSGMKMKM